MCAEPKKRGGQPVPPELQRVRVNIRLPRWLNEWLAAQDKPGHVAESALIKVHKLKAPDAQRMRKEGKK